jgi:TM2 domain-containing membrane protein YozV
MRLALALMLSATAAFAQTTPERELELARALFDAGKYAETVSLVRKALGVTNFTDEQRIELHRMAGLSSFNLGEVSSAKESFLALLRLNPDYVLDPFIAPPPALRLFEQVRKDASDELTLVRQLLQVRAEQRRRDEEERRKAEQARGTGRTITIERRPFWMNFLPFGAGQFQQDRTGWGIAFAVTEGVFAITSIVAYWAIELLKVDFRESYDGLLTNQTGRTIRGIPQSAEGQRDAWRIVKFSTGGAFYAAWIAGIVDAILHHPGDKRTETKDAEPPPPRLNLTPMPGGGLYAGMTVFF